MMLLKTFVVLMAFCSPLVMATDYGYLKAEDQKYYKNEAGQGMNQLERIDSVVKEINKLHGEIASLKSEISNLKNEVEKLKK